MEKCVSQLPLAAGTCGMGPWGFLLRLTAELQTTFPVPSLISVNTEWLVTWIGYRANFLKHLEPFHHPDAL